MQDTLRLFVPPVAPSMWWWPALLATLVLWRHRSRSRRQLAELDDRELTDIGITRAERWHECRKRFWQA